MVTPWRMTQKVPALRGCVQATWGLGVRAWGCRARIPEAPGPRQSRPPSPGDLRHPGSVSSSDKKSVSRGDSPRHPGRRRLVDPLCRAGPRCHGNRVSTQDTGSTRWETRAWEHRTWGLHLNSKRLCSKTRNKRKTSRRPEVFAYPVSDTESAPRKCI